MATGSVTKVVEFNKAPAYPCGLFQVNAGIDTFHSLGEASIIMDYVKERLDSMVGETGETDEPWILSLLTDMAHAIYKASGAES